MKYLCLVYLEEEQMEAMSREEWVALNGECLAHSERVRASGHCLAAEALQPVRTAVTVRVRNGKVSTTDGPFAETREQLGGFYLVDARDMDEAVELASRIPPARLGSIEVRPVRDIRFP